MKKLVLMLFLISMVSCSKDEDPQEQLTEDYSLDQAICFCFYEPDFNFKGFKLSFTEGSSKVRLESPMESTYFIAPNGTYDYSINGDILTINNMSFKFKKDSDILILNFLDEPQIADDELTLIYKKD